MLGNDDIEVLVDEPINAIDLFGEDEEETPLIPPLSPDANQDTAAADADGDAAAAGTTEPKKVRRLYHLPNLNERWITDPNKEGLHAVNKYFEKIKLKRGKGHELTNLKTILKRYEYWAQQCFPKLCFKDFVDRVEGLNGKLVKNTLQEIRNKTTRFSDIIEENADDDDSGITVPVDHGSPGNSNVFPTLSQPITSPSQAFTSFSSPQSVTNSNDTISDDMKEMIRRKREEAIAKRKRKLDESLNTSDISMSQSNEVVENNICGEKNDDSPDIPQYNEDKTIATDLQQSLDSSYMSVSQTNEEIKDCNPIEQPLNSDHGSISQSDKEIENTDVIEHSLNYLDVSAPQPNERIENNEIPEIEKGKTTLVTEEMTEVINKEEPMYSNEKEKMEIDEHEITNEHTAETVLE